MDNQGGGHASQRYKLSISWRLVISSTRPFVNRLKRSDLLDPNLTFPCRVTLAYSAESSLKGKDQYS